MMPPAAAEALIQLIENPDLRNQMGAAASQRVKNNFSLEKQVAQYAAMFEKVMA
jgi:glycosyltransferase involved in cell wall biosynthesis